MNLLALYRKHKYLLISGVFMLVFSLASPVVNTIVNHRLKDDCKKLNKGYFDNLLTIPSLRISTSCIVPKEKKEDEKSKITGNSTSDLVYYWK